MSNAKLIVVTLVAGLMLTGSAYATTADLQNAAQATPGIMNMWSFEGAAVEIDPVGSPGVMGLLATVGGVNLVEDNDGPHNPDAEPPEPLTHIEYDVAGYDASSKAASTWRTIPGTDFGHGDAFVTAAPITPPTTFSYEVVIKTGTVPIDGGTWDLGYIIGHRPGGPRGYFLWQGTMGGGHDPVTFPQGGAQLSSLTGEWSATDENTIVATLPSDNWYYVATTYSVDTGALPADPSDDTTTVNSYVADLTAGDTVLTTMGIVITGSAVNSYDYGVPGQFGIGKRHDGSAEAFPGILDEVYLYEAALSGATLQAHLDQLLIPEPATMTLLLLGGALVTARRRRRK